MAKSYIVVLNWNGYLDTIGCVESLRNLDCNNFAVVVVDNGSTDGSADQIVEHFGLCQTEEASGYYEEGGNKLSSAAGVIAMSDGSNPAPLMLICTSENLGFAGGNNIGIRLALEDDDCRYVWVLNNDTVVQEGALTELLLIMDRELDVAICGSTLAYYSDRQCVQALGGTFDYLKGRPGQIAKDSLFSALPTREEVEAQIEYVVGASMMIRRETLERVGGISEKYFLYFEEIDLAHRLLPPERLGWAPKSLVYHKVGASIEGGSGCSQSRTGQYHENVSLLIFLSTHRPLYLAFGVLKIFRDILRETVSLNFGRVELLVRVLFDVVSGKIKRGPITP